MLLLFSTVSTAMSSATTKDFWAYLETLEYDNANPNKMTKGYIMKILYAHSKKKKPYLLAMDDIARISGLKIDRKKLRPYLEYFKGRVDHKKKHLYRSGVWSELIAELSESFILPVVADSDSTSTTSSATATCPVIITPEPVNIQTKPEVTASTSAAVAKPQKTPKKETPDHSQNKRRRLTPATKIRVLRQDCRGCISLKIRLAKLEEEKLTLQRHLDKQQDNILNLMSTVDDMKRKLRVKQKDCKTATKKFKRKEAIEVELRRKRQDLKDFNYSLMQQVQNIKNPLQASREQKNLKIKLSAMERKCGERQREADSLLAQNKLLLKEVKDLKDANDYLIAIQEKPEDEKHQVIPTSVRKATYRALLAQCPVSQVGQLIEGMVSEISGTTIHGPSKSTAARMAHELSVLSSIQTVECLLECDVATISWDATSEAGNHVNEIHISLSNQTMHTLSIDRLPGGTAQDYSNHIIKAVNEIAETYAAFTKTEYAIVRGRILSKIMSSLTDRAAVNHATVRLLNLHLGLELTEMNCNLHVLDGFANKVRGALKGLDEAMTDESGGR